MIIQGHMVAQGDTNQKYIAIVREDEIHEALPLYMKSTYAFTWGKGEDLDPERLRELVLCLFDGDTHPELGAIPAYVQQRIKKN